MDVTIVVVIAYGLFCLVGGIIGYAKAKSRASLIAGIISGIVLFVSAYGMTEGIRIASFVVLIAAVLLGVRFLKTWMKTRRLMPDLLMILLSLVTLIVVGLDMLGV